MTTALVMSVICVFAVAFYCRFFVALCAEKPTERCELRPVSTRKPHRANVEAAASDERWAEFSYEFELALEQEKRSGSRAS